MVHHAKVLCLAGLGWLAGMCGVNATAHAQNTLHFTGGFLISDTLDSEEDVGTGLSFDTRHTFVPHLHWSAHIGGELHPDVEHIVTLVDTGLGLGSSVDVGIGTLYGSGRLGWLNVWDWETPSDMYPAPLETVHDGWRAEVHVGAAVWLGSVLGHPMGLDLRLARRGDTIRDTHHVTYSALAGLVAQLLPEP